MTRPIGRRAFVAGAGALALTGCDRVLSGLASLAGDRLPDHFEPPDGEEIDPVHHLLSRAAFGPRPGQVEEVRRVGVDAWIDAQLDPTSIDDAAAQLRTDVIDTVQLSPGLLVEFPPEQVELELRRRTLLGAIYSKRQLFEVMVEHWTDHFNIAIGKSLCRHFKTDDDREVVRRHALGRFRDLLGASALSPAMLVYLDGRDNKKESPADAPNENYARELMELHTLGVHGGYSQRDVMEAARCLTGFVVDEKWAPGTVTFVAARHDDGEKTVLGHRIAPGGGRADVETLLDIVADHPSTARFVSAKLCATFVADDPPQSIVDAATRTFADSRGDLRRTVKTILTSDEMAAARAAKVKRPFRLLVSALRALGADTHAKGDLLEHLGRMGQMPFSYPTPDGYPTRSDAWFGTLFWRWAFSLALAEDRIDGVRVDWPGLRRALGEQEPLARLARHLFGRRPTSKELAAVSRYDGPRREAKEVALLLSSPAFQRH